MKALSFLLLPVLLLAAPLCAHGDAYKPWVGKINGDSVRLRSGPSMQHPPVHVLGRGDELTVIAEKDGFAIVRLPAAAPCWVASEFVKLADDGQNYTVTGDNINLRCTADTKFFAIGQVDKGSTLKAVMDGQTGKPAAENGFAKVTPPKQALGAVSAAFLDKVRDVEADKPATPAEAPKAEPAKDAKPAKQATPQELEDERKGFASLQGLLRDELKKPSAEVNLTGIRKLFQQFVEFSLDPTISDSAKKDIERIDATVKLIAEESKKAADDAAKRQVELNKLRDAALHKDEPKEEPKGPVEYLVTGTLGSTGKSAKTPASHRLFDAEGKVLYDLRWDKGDLGKLMGCKVGIVGTVKEYDGWPNKVIVIERIDVMSDEEDK